MEKTNDANLDLMKRILYSREPLPNLFCTVCEECSKHLPDGLPSGEYLQHENPATGKIEFITEVEALEIGHALKMAIVLVPCDIPSHADGYKLCYQRPDWPKD